MRKTTALDLEYLEKILNGKAERKDEGSKRKERPTSMPDLMEPKPIVELHAF